MPWTVNPDHGYLDWKDHTSGPNPDINEIEVDLATPPGTDPVVADANGVITITGAQISSNSTSNVIRTHSTAANSFRIEVQQADVSAAENTALNGVAHFNSAQFTISNGFVSLTGGGAAIDSIAVDASTAPGTDPVVPDASGIITVTGAQVAASTIGPNVIRTNSLAANTYTIEIQRSTVSTTSDSTKNGVCHFSDTDFNVDANGFVTANGRSILWKTITASQTLVINEGYFCISPGGALSLALPATATIGDIIEVTLDGATSWTITQAAGQQIRFGNVQTTSGVGGSLASTAAGDTIRMVAQTATKWNVISSVGVLNVV